MWNISSPVTTATARCDAYSASPVTITATPARQGHVASPARLRDGRRCARRNRLSAGAVIGMSASALQRAENRRCDGSDRPCAEQHDQIARLSDRGELARYVAQRPDDPQISIEARTHGIRQRVERHARDRILAGGVNIRQQQYVRAGERARELPEQELRSRVPVRLKRENQLSFDNRFGSGDDGGYFRRVMSVILHDRHSCGFAPALEAALGAVKSAEPARDIAPRNAQLPRHCRRSERVEYVVATGNGELQLPELDGAATWLTCADGTHRSVAFQPNVQRGDIGRLVESVRDNMALDVAANGP